MSIPVCLSLQDRHVYIIGGGKVAYRKYQAFQNEGATISIISPKFDACFPFHKEVEYIHAKFSWTYIKEDAFLIYAASDDQSVNQAIVKEAKQRHILCGCANQGMDSDIQSMAVWKGEQVQFALSTNGNCPAADRVFLDQLSNAFTDFDKRVEVLASLRQRLLSSTMDKHSIRTILQTAAMFSYAYLKQLLAAMQGKQCLFIAYHGIANGKQFQPVLSQIQQEVQQRHPDIVVISVFLSKKIVHKAKAKGYDIEHIETITQLFDKLHINYQIQPVILHAGYYYQTLQKRYATCLSTPLCASIQDSERILSALQQAHPKETLLCIYHGGDHVRCQSLPKQASVFYVAMDQPLHIPTSCTHLHVIPYCILCGYHVDKDIQERWLPYLYSHIPHVSYHKEGLLSYPACRELLYEKINSLLTNVQ